MNANYRLPSLHLGTSFDEPIAPIQVPGILGKGTASALCILAGANRAPHRLSRLVRPVALLGIKLANPRDGVRITVRLLSDDLSTSMWDKHTYRLRGEPRSQDEEHVLSDVSTRHRLAEITAQGRSRALAVLALRRNDEGTVRQHVSFEVSADEIDESGLLMIGLENPLHAPDWSRVNELQDSLVGTCVARLTIEHLDTRVHANVSTGRPGVGHTPIAAANPGFFVLNPPGEGGATKVSITARGAEGEGLLGRRAKVKHPVRYARERYQDHQVDTRSPAVVDVVDRHGATVLETEVPEDSDGRHQFEVPGGAGPVFIRPRKLIGGQPRSVNWSVRARPDKG